MTLRPLGTKVVVEPAAAEEKTAGGIVLPDTAQKKSQEGKVLAVGKGRTLDSGEVVALPIKVGDTVIYSKYGGNEVSLEGKDYVILDEDNIYAVKE